MIRALTGLVLAVGIFVASFSPASAFLDKTRFVAHLGVAYFCFHHWVLVPYERGAFNAGAPHRTVKIIKGGAALLFAVHEVQVAKKIADRSHDPLLHSIALKLAVMGVSFGAIGHELQSGHFNPSDIMQLKGETEGVNSDSTAAGAPIHDVPATLPGT
jgi:hypothetical protein